MNTEDFDTLAPGDQELFAGLHRSVAGATLGVGTADVVALGRRTRNRHRAVAAGIGTSAVAAVAAVGLLASSPETGVHTGSARIATAPQKPVGTSASTASTGSQTLDIQEAGFSLKTHADGTVYLTFQQLFDPVVLQSALEKAGVPAAVLVEQVPEGWDTSRGIECTPDPGVSDAGSAGRGVFQFHPAAGYDVAIDKNAIPAGDFVTLIQFRIHGRPMDASIDVKTGRQTTCVPERSAGKSAAR